MVLSLTDPHLIRFMFAGLQDIRHYDEEHSYHRFLRVHNCPSVYVGSIHDSVGSERSRYGVYLCGRRLLILMACVCRRSSATASSYSPHGIPILCFHQTSEGGNCLHGHLALLRFAFFSFQKSSISIRSITTDISAFLVIIILAAKSGIRGFRMPGILRTIVQDATVYFLVIFTSHFVLEMTLLLARVNISVTGVGTMLRFLQPNLQLLPAV